VNDDATGTAVPSEDSSGDGRLDSWKEIGAYLRRDVTTVRRWEKREGLPVHRHLHDRRDSVYAYRSEIDEWWQNRRNHLGARIAVDAVAPGHDRERVAWSVAAVAIAVTSARRSPSVVHCAGARSPKYASIQPPGGRRSGPWRVAGWTAARVRRRLAMVRRGCPAAAR
jgi:hypothetical protein